MPKRNRIRYPYHPPTAKMRNLLTPSKTNPCFNVSAVQVFENTMGKGEIARNEQFLIFPQCFLSLLITFCNFYKI